MNTITKNEWSIDGYKIDGKISLLETMRKAEWHRQTAVDALVAQGITSEDAAGFVDFAFGEVEWQTLNREQVKDRVAANDRPQDRLEDAGLYDRLSI